MLKSVNVPDRLRQGKSPGISKKGVGVIKAFQSLKLKLSSRPDDLSNLPLKYVAVTNPPYRLMKRVRNYFTGRSQYIPAHDKSSSAVPNNCGVLFFHCSFSTLTFPIFSLNH